MYSVYFFLFATPIYLAIMIAFFPSGATAFAAASLPVPSIPLTGGLPAAWERTPRITNRDPAFGES